MRKKAFLFTALLSLLSTLLYGQLLLTFSPPTLSDGEYGYPYNQQLTVTGGTAPYTFTVTLGNLPPGMSLSSDGILSGTPTAIGTYLFTVTARDNSPLLPLIGLQIYTLVVDQAPLTITANPVTMTYGGALPPLTVSYSGFVNGDNATSLTTQPTIGTTASSSSGVGSYPINVSSAADPNYTFTYVPGTVTVGPANLTITADPAGSVYGAPLEADGALTVSYSGFVNGDGAASLATLPSVTNAANANSPVGGYLLTPLGAQGNNYSVTYVDGLYTISPAPLTITAVNQTMTYGGAVPVLTASYTGLVHGDGPGSLATPPSLSTTANPTSPAGPYTISAIGAADPNYTISYAPGTLTVGKAELTVTADDKTMPLGGPLPALTVSYAGFVNGDNAASLMTAPTATTTATAASGVDTYTISPAGGVASNYSFSYVNGTLTVGKAVLTITAVPAGSVYGAPVLTGGSLAVTYSGFVNGDGPGNLTSLPIVTNGAGAGSPAGNYTLTPSGAQSSNYTINYVNAAYTISPAPLTINAVNQTMTYGGPVPTLTAAYSGFVNGDGPGSLTTPPTITTAATVTSPVATYPIGITGAVDHNYTITYNPGTITVGQATLTITADSKAMPLGGPLPALTVSYSGFVNGENASSLTTQPSVTVPATASSPAGSYSITAFGAAAANYTFAYVPGILAVGKALLTITVNPAGSVYGAALVPNSSFTFSYAGFVNGDGPGSLTQLPTAANTAVTGSPAGNYAIIPSGAQDPNYVINYVNGTYTIGPAALTITASNATMTYGGSVPPLTATYSGFVNGDGPGSLSTPPIVTTTATPASPAGTYPTTAHGGVDGNYSITYIAGTMTVQQATVTITPNPASMTYGGTVPAFTAAYSGFVNGDGPASLAARPAITTTATSGSPAGTYPITASGAVSSNYNFVYNPGTLTVGPATIHVTAGAATKKYGTPDPTFSYTVTGLLNGDNSGVFTGSLSRTPGEDVGTYPITPGDLSAGGNYTISYTGNLLTITIGSQQIAWAQSLIVGCNSVTQVSLTATASSGLPITYSVSDPDVASVSGNILTLLRPGTAIVTATQAGDGNYTAAPAVKDTIDYQSASLIRQRWADAIFFDNSSGDYVQWQWYKNGDPIPGATDPYYSETPDLDGQYFVIATNKDSELVQSCILTITPGAVIPGGIKAYPNPTTPGGMVTIASNYTGSDLQGAMLQVVDLNGRVRQQLTGIQSSMQVTMPAETGTYIINLLLASGQKASANVLVLPQ